MLELKIKFKDELNCWMKNCNRKDCVTKVIDLRPECLAMALPWRCYGVAMVEEQTWAGHFLYIFRWIRWFLFLFPCSRSSSSFCCCCCFCCCRCRFCFFSDFSVNKTKDKRPRGVWRIPDSDSPSVKDRTHQTGRGQRVSNRWRTHLSRTICHWHAPSSSALFQASGSPSHTPFLLLSPLILILILILILVLLFVWKFFV